MTDKNIDKKDETTNDEPVTEETKTTTNVEPKIVETKTTTTDDESSCKCDESADTCGCDDEDKDDNKTESHKVKVEYEVYGNEMRDEAKKTVDGIIGDIFSTLKSKQDEFNKTMGDIRSNKPQFDVFTTSEDLIVKVDLPRVKKEDIYLKVSTEAIEVDATFPDDLKEYENIKIIRRDRCYGETKLLIPLPEEVAINEVKATFEDNVLTVAIPKIRGRKVSLDIE